MGQYRLLCLAELYGTAALVLGTMQDNRNFTAPAALIEFQSALAGSLTENDGLGRTRPLQVLAHIQKYPFREPSGRTHTTLGSRIKYPDKSARSGAAIQIVVERQNVDGINLQFRRCHSDSSAKQWRFK